MRKNLKHCSFIILTVFWIIFAVHLQIVFSVNETIADQNMVVVIRSHQVAAYDEAVKGFEKGCKERNISIKKIYDLNGDIEAGKKAIQDIKSKRAKPDLILTVGVLAATLAKNQFTDIPIIFCMVIHHERFNLQGANITGISTEVPIEDQFVILKALLGVDKKIGVIYDPSNTKNVVLEAISVADKLGLKLVKSEVTSSKKVVSAFKKIANTIDALWIIPDSTVITKKSLNNVLKRALKRHLPTFCTSSAIVNAGAVASISPDYTCIGLQASRIARKLLNNTMAIVPDISQPDKLKLSFNTQIADVVGVDITAIQSLQNKNEFYVRESDNSVEGNIEWCKLSSLTIFGPIEFE